MKKRLHVNALAALAVSMLLTSADASDSPLADAAMKGDATAVRTLLASGADVNAARGDGMTALHWAAETGNAEITEILVSAGAILEVTTRLGAYTPLHVAGRKGAAGVIRVLLDAGADPRTVAATGSTPLHLVAGAGSALGAQHLVDAGAEVNARAGDAQQTPLMFAAAADRADVVTLLVARGADPNVTTTLMEAATRSEVDNYASERMQEVLDAFKGDSNELPTPAQIQAALEVARAVQRAGVVPEEEEEEDEDDPRAFFRQPPDQKWGSLTALHHAAREGAIDAAMALLDGGADIDFVTEADNTSPLTMAVINGRFDLAMKLLERGANPNLATVDGVAPLYATFNVQWSPRSRYPQPRAHEQQETVYLDLAMALLEAGAEVDFQVTKNFWYFTYSGCGNGNCGLENQDGVTPFWRASRALDLDGMKLLRSWGADWNIATVKQPERRRGRNPRTGDTEDEEQVDPSGLPPVPVGGPAVYPIHAASGVGYGQGFAGNAHTHIPGNWIAAVEYLLELGADINQRDANGYTPLHHAAARGDTEMIQWLVDRGADVMVVSRRGQTTVDMANGPVSRVTPYPEAIALLESMGAINNHNCISC
ncbi:MAG: ankyrin repeat domain-containing protein [Gammaproteobacteria bacterium]|nr:ankyrin repeat domain-containing protein [Gammaproteobacteria bacterium]MDE0257058.1 ankyrin repeat domain-containing protein [Gammaproteobacteria bacterium]